MAGMGGQLIAGEVFHAFNVRIKASNRHTQPFGGIGFCATLKARRSTWPLVQLDEISFLVS